MTSNNTDLEAHRARDKQISGRSRRRRMVAAAITLVLGAGGAVAVVAVAGPASAFTPCEEIVSAGQIRITQPGNWSGTSGNDVVIITANGATYNPVGGSDVVCIEAPAGSTVWANSSGGPHTVWGGPGPDYVYGSPAGDTLYGEAGNDLLKGNGGDDRIFGHAGDDYILGNAGYDSNVDGGYGNDCILGGPDGSYISGGGGDDTILIGYEFRYSSTQCAPDEEDQSPAAQAFRNNLNDDGGSADGDGGWTSSGPGNDRIWGSNGADHIRGGTNVSGYDGNDLVNGWQGNDTIYGGAGTDVLRGGGGNDVVRGELGSFDSVYGGAGTDTLYGSGTDVCFPDNGPATQTCLAG